MEFYKEIDKEVEKIKNEYNYPNSGIAFSHFCIEKCFRNLIYIDDDTNIKDYIVDGKSDLGVDAIVIEEEDKKISLFQFKYSSSTPQLEKRDIEKAFNVIEYILHKTNFDPNGKVKEKIDNLISNYDKEELRDEWETIFYFVDSGFKDDVKKQFQFSLEKYLKDYSLDSHDITCQFLDYNNLQDYQNTTVIPKNHFEMTLKSSPLQWQEEYYDDNSNEKTKMNSLWGLLDITSLKKMYDDKKNALFELNVRFGKTSSPVNKKIREELEKGENSNFPIKNNGLTAICKKFAVNGNIVTVENIQIVNGAQTTTVIGKLDASQIDKLNDKYVLIKLFEIDSEVVNIEKYQLISQDITTSSNYQNAIKDRDLHSNDKEQNYFKNQFAKYGIYLKKKDNEIKPREFKVCITNMAVGKTYMTFFIGMPVTIIGKYKQIFLEPYYSEIFNMKEEQVIKLLFAYKITSLVKKICNEKPDDDKKSLKEIHPFLREVLSGCDFLTYFSLIYFGKEFYKKDSSIKYDKLIKKINEKDFSIYLNSKYDIDDEKIDRQEYKKFLSKLLDELDNKTQVGGNDVGLTKAQLISARDSNLIGLFEKLNKDKLLFSEY